MNGNVFKVAAAAVVVVFVVVGGLAFLGGRQGDVGAPPTVAPTAQPSVTPTSSSSNLTPGTLCTGFCLTGTLDPGTYSFEAGGYSPVALTFTVPAGWTITGDGFVTKHAEGQGELQFSTWDVTHVFADVCNDSVAPVDAGTTAGELASVLSGQTRHTSAVTDVTLGGIPAKQIEMTLQGDGCIEPAGYRFWPGPGPDLNSGYCCMADGSTVTASAVDVDGKRLVVVAYHEAASTTADQAELEAIVDSIAIGDTVSPSP
jgi:hypothetical protein